MKEKNVSQQDAEAKAKADLLVLSDRIYTAELSQPWVEAFTVKDGVFTYVGDLKGAINHIGPSTVVIDAFDRMVIPGIVDNHSHYLWIGALTSMMPWNLFNCKTVADIQAVVKKTAGKNSKLPFVGGIGWHPECLGDNPKKSLDEAVLDRPVLLMSYGGQSGWANTKAVELLSKNAEAFDELSPERDESGKPTGIFKHFHSFNPFDYFKQEEMAPAERPMIMAMWRSVNEALSLGITSVNDVQIYKQFYHCLSRFKNQGGLHRLRARVSLYVGPGMFQKIEKLQKILTWWTGLKSEPYSDDHLKLGDSVKFYIDGVYNNHTAFLCAPYYDDKTGTKVGVPDWTEDDFKAVISLIDSMKLQACTHASGDAGAKRVIDSYELAIKTNPIWDRRHRIEHATLLRAADLPRMASSGILAAMQPTHLASGPVEKYLGPDRVQSYVPWKSMIDAGINVCFGSDWCAGPANPAYGLLVAATRLNYKFECNWAPEQAIPFEEALYLYTAKSAHALKMEKKIGSIKPGKRADFVIFSEDLTDILTYRHILTKKSEMGTGLDDLVLATFTDGKIAYCKTGWTMLEVGKANVNFRFTPNKKTADSLSIKGTVEWPENLPLQGAEVTISVGDLELDFTLDKKGQGKLGKNTVLTIRPPLGESNLLGIMRFNLKIRKAVLFDSFKSYGFTQNIDIKIPGEKHSVPVVFIIDGGMQATMVDFIYTAEADKSGKGEGKGRPFELPSWLSWFWKTMI